MNIKLTNPRNGLKPFEWQNIPKLVVLLGKNGVGKSQLLRAIQEACTWQISYPLLKESDVQLVGFDRDKDTASHIESWDIGDPQQAGDNEKLQLLQQYFNEFTNYCRGQARPKGKKLENFDHIISLGLNENSTQDEFKAVVPEDFYFDEEQLVSQRLSIAFRDYFEKYILKRSELFDNRARKNKLEKYQKELGEAPWDVFNRAMEQAGLQFRVKIPTDFEPITVPLYKYDTSERILWQNLSSGEKVLIRLASWIFAYEAKKGAFPRLLMLDEPDSPLHPSMIKNLFGVIEGLLVKERGVRVIMTTHSPTAVAFAPDDSLFELKNTKDVTSVEPITKENAIELLSEGLVTLQKGTQIFDALGNKEAYILSEGRNSVYIQKALDLYGIKNVGIIEGMEDVSGKAQLKAIFDFLCAIPHDKKIIIVWDCDVTTQVVESGNTYPFFFAKNDKNRIAQKGIENLFDESLFDGFTNTFKKSNGEETEIFDGRKVDLEKSILSRNKREDFVNFQPLMNKVMEITEK